jgi:hypothetical protein
MEVRLHAAYVNVFAPFFASLRGGNARKCAKTAPVTARVVVDAVFGAFQEADYAAMIGPKWFRIASRGTVT